MEFGIRLLTEIEGIEIIAVRHSIRDQRMLRRRYGRGRWRKLKGFATVERSDGAIFVLNYTGTKRTASAGGS